MAAIGAAADRRLGFDEDVELPEAEEVDDASRVVNWVAAELTDVAVGLFGAFHFCIRKSLLPVGCWSG